MVTVNLLHIYDSDDTLMRQTAPFQSWHESDIKQVGVRGGVKGLRRELDKLLYYGWTFGKIVFQTHGSSGGISFAQERLNRDRLLSEFDNRGYEKLFPMVQTRMYFNGCNVADGDRGWSFLETAASIFLKTMGGVSFGHTSVGFAMHPAVSMFLMSGIVYPLVAGKTVHPWGETRYVYVGPGGKFVKREVRQN